jgi:O-antigen ligase
VVRLQQPELLLAIVALPVAGLVLLRQGRLEHGILGIVLAAAIVRFSLPTGTYSRIVMSLVVTAGVLALWIVKMLVKEKKLRLEPAPTNVPLLGFALTCVVSYVWSNAFRDPLVVAWRSWPFVQLGGLAVMTLLPGAFLITANCLQETKWIVWLAVIILVVGTVAMAGRYLHFSVDFLQVRPLFPTWCISLAYALALFDRRLPWTIRLALLLLAAAWFHDVFVIQFGWVSAWAPALSAVALISFLRSKILLLLLTVLLIIFLLFNWTTVEARLQQESVGSGETRLDAYAHNWRVTGKHWLFGVGPAGYAVYYMSYFPMEAMATHSTYIDTLSQTGIVGLCFFLWFFAALFKIGWDLWKRTRKRFDFTEAFTAALAGGYVGTVLAMGLGDWIIPFVYTQTIEGFDYAVYTWVLLGAGLSLYHILSGSDAEA